jgi:hypothetical protein
VKEIAYDNLAALKRLEEEDSWLTTAYSAAGAVDATTVFVSEPLTKTDSFLRGMVADSLLLKRTQKINNILRNAKALDEAFKDQQLQIFPDLPVPERGRLDMLLKFPIPPRKTLFAVALRSQGKATIFYHEQKQALYVRQYQGGLKLWKPDHIEQLALQEFWLRQNRQQELFGTSHRDKTRSVVKLLVLTGQTKLGQHNESLYTDIGDQRVLLLQRRSTIYVLEEKQLLLFIKAWLDPARIAQCKICAGVD